VKMMKRHPAMALVTTLGLLFQLGFSFLVALGVVGGVLAFQSSTGSIVGIVLFSMFSLYWTSQVVKNVIHVTVSGTFADYYFTLGHNNGEQTPVNPTLKAFRRSVTHSFGSICLGSLIVALIEMLFSTSARPGFSGAMVNCVGCCCVKLAEYFNKYAFVHVAIYGDSFIDSAKASWSFIKSRGVDALVNDCLIFSLMNMVVLFMLLVTGVSSYFISYDQYADYFYTSSYEVASGASMMIAIGVSLSIVISLLLFGVVMQIVESGVAALFVCLAREPELLLNINPEFHGLCQNKYPFLFQQL